MPTYKKYSRDGSIAEFFDSKTAVTRQECDEFATSHVGGVAAPLQMQGESSYTITAGPDNSKVFQFREERSTLDMQNMTLAKAIHPEVVPSCSYLGTIGETRPVHVYEMDKLGGTPQVFAKIEADDFVRQSNTVKGLARFFAQSWNNRQQASAAEAAVLLAEYQSDLDRLARELPARFRGVVESVRKDLPAIFSSSTAAPLPFVLSHGDLNIVNVLVGLETGHLTGVSGWAESRILPFGLALYGIEHFLGWMDSKGWHWNAKYRELDAIFWQTFRDHASGFSGRSSDWGLLRSARLAGILVRYGFEYECTHDGTGKAKVVRVDADADAGAGADVRGPLAYLDAFTTRQPLFLAAEQGGV